MGAWGTGILDNDFSQDLYADINDLYNQGIKVPDILIQIQNEYEVLDFEDEYYTDYWLVIALFKWEAKSLDEETLHKIKSIIENGQDIKKWKALEATEEDIVDRKIKLDDFLMKISSKKGTLKVRKGKKKKWWQF